MDTPARFPLRQHRLFLVLSFSCFLFTPGSPLADEVFLKNAGTISGRIVEQTDEVVKVDIGDGIVGVPTSSVERIVKGKTPLDEYEERASRLGPQDAKGWRGLGRWASQRGLSSQAREAYEHVLTVSPDDAEARQALGFVQLDGRWVTEEESYRARGYVKYDGEWMTAAEVQVAQSEAAAFEAERRAAQAEIAALEAQRRADEAEQEAREAQADRDSGQPVYWGGWGYGTTYWPSTPNRGQRPKRPAQLPARGGR